MNFADAENRLCHEADSKDFLDRSLRRFDILRTDIANTWFCMAT